MRAVPIDVSPGVLPAPDPLDKESIVSHTVHVEIVMDVVCAPSYLSYTRFQRAAARHRAGGGDVEVTFRPFQLDPGAPPYGEPLADVLLRRFGPGFREFVAPAAVEASEEGVVIDFDHAVAANTFEAHRLIATAARQGLGERMAERLFRAHFADGRDVGDHETLAELADEVGVGVRDPGSDDLRGELRRVRELGVTGVPVFSFDGRLTLSGAQSEEALLAALQRAGATS